MSTQPGQPDQPAPNQPYPPQNIQDYPPQQAPKYPEQPYPSVDPYNSPYVQTYPGAAEPPPGGSARTRDSHAALPAGVRLAGLAVLVAVVMCVLIIALGWPAINGGAHHLPIGLAGPAQATAPVNQALTGAQPGAFDITTYPDGQSLRTAILHRQVYGGLVVEPTGGDMLVASAASPVVAQALQGVAAQLGSSTGVPIDVTDVAPLPTADPSGIGLAALAVPLALGGIAIAAGLMLLLADRSSLRAAGIQAAGIVAASLVGGFAVTAIEQYGFGSLTGSYWWTSLTLALGVGAIGFALTGLQMLIGRVGRLVGVLGVVVFGLSVSGMQSAPELLPAGWGTVGQLFPHGATGTALRSVVFFSGHGSGSSLLVLGAWVVGGLVLMLIAAAVRRPRPAANPA